MTSRESSEPEVPPTRKIITADEYDKARSREFSPYMDFALVEGDKPIVTSEFTCPICLDLLFKTVTAKDCLHRFCSDCINMALHKGNRECPTCRSKIISKRDLRSDKRFDAIVKAMWPDRQEYARIVREYEEANQKESTDYYRAQENSHASSLMEDIRNMAIPVNASDPDMEPDESRAKKLVSKFHKAVDILYENGDLEQCLNVIGTCRPSLNNRKSNMEGSDEESLNSPTALLRTVLNYNSLEEVLEANPLNSKDDEEEEEEDEEDEEEANSSLDGSDTKSVSKRDEANRMESSDAPAETRGLKRKHKEQNKDEVQLIKNAEPDTKKVKSEELLQADASTSQCGLQSMKNDIDEQQGTQSSLQVTQSFPQTSKSYYAQTTSGQAFVISKKAIKSIKAQDRDDHEANDDEEEEEYEDEEDDEDEDEYDEEEDDDETEVNNDSRVLPKRIVTIRKDGRLTEAEKRYHNYARRTQGLLFQTGLVGSIGVARPPGVIQNIGAAANMEDLRNPTSIKHLKIVQRRLSGHSSEDSEGDEFDENEEDEEEYEELDKYNEEKSGVQLDVNEVNGGQEKKLDYYNDEKNEEEKYDIEDLARLTQAHHDDLQRMYIRNFLAGLLDTYEDKNLRWKVNFRQLFMEDPPECKISDTFFAYVCKRRFTYINENPEFSAYYYMMKNINYSDKWNRQNSLFYDLMFGDRTLNGIDDKFETAYKKEILDFSRIKDSHEYGNYDIFYNESEEDEFAGIETDEDREKISEEGGYEGESTVRFKPFTQPLDLGISSCSSSEDEKTRQIAKKKISKNRYYVSKHARLEKAFHFDEVVGFMNENAMLERDKYLKKKAAQRNLKKSSGEESKEYSGEDTSDSDEEAKDTREKSSVAENGASNKDVVSENVPGEPDCMDVDIVDEDEGNEADNEDNSDEDLELTGDSECSENLSDDSEDETQIKNDEFWLDRLTREAKKKVSNLPRGSPESSDIGTESDRETAYHLNRCGLPKVSREFMEYIKHSRLWYTILKHPYNKAKLCLKRSAKFYLRAWRDTLSGVYDPAAIRGEELIPEDPDVALPKVFFEYNTFFKSRPAAAVKRYWRSDVLIKPEYAASNRSMCHVDTIMKRSNYLGLDEYIDDEEIYVNPELYGESNCSESYDSEIDDDEYHDSGKYREDVDNIIKNHNFSEILQGLPDFEKNGEVMTALNNLRDLVIQYKRTRTNCLDFMSSILPMNSPLSYFRVADCDLQYAAEVYKPLFVEDKALFRKHNRVVEVDDEESEEYSSNSDDSECYENYHYAEDVEEPEEADYRESSEVQTNSNDGVVENDEMEIGDNFNKSEDCGGTKEPEENDSYKMISSERMEICGESVKSVNSGEDSSSEYEDVVDDEAEDFEKETENMTSEQREKLLLELVNEIEKEISEVCGKQLNDSDLEEHISDRSEEDSLDSSEEESETENESDSVEETTSEEDSTEVSDAESDAPTINEDADEKMEVISAECSNREVLKQPEHLNGAAEEDSDSMSEEESDQNSEISSQNDSDDLSEDFFVETSEQELGDETDDTSEVTSDESSDDSDDSTGESSYEGVFGEEIESCSEESDGTFEEECGSSLELSNNLDDIEDEESECTVDSDGDSLTESDENSDAMATEESDGNSIEDTGETSVDDFERQSRNTSEEDSEDADDASEEEYGSSEGESELEPEEEEEKLEVSDETYPKLSCDSDMHDGYNKNDEEDEDEEDAEMELDDDVSDEEIEDEDFDEPSEQSEYEEPEIVDELVNETVRVFKKRLQKVNKDGYVSLDEEDEEDLYGEQEEDVYVTNMGTIRNTVARKMTRKPESTKEDETVYDEKWDYTHGNMEYEKLKEDVDAFDLKSRPTILDAFKTRRIYDPVNFNARKNFALVPLYDDYGLKSYLPDPREDASSVQAIINSTY